LIENLRLAMVFNQPSAIINQQLLRAREEVMTIRPYLQPPVVRN
jgi:hypothetical protein